MREYFQILKDTLIAHEVPAWKATVKRKAIATSKYYFFDVGVLRQLQNGGPLRARSVELGPAFETYVFHELKAYVDYKAAGEIRYWRSKSGYEVDFIVSDRLAVEVKAKERLADRDLRGMRALKEEKLLKHHVVLSLEKRTRVVDGVRIMPWEQFLSALWDGEFGV